MTLGAKSLHDAHCCLETLKCSARIAIVVGIVLYYLL